ncbi:MAG: sigma-70 family RNA polymerase sigma factor [Lentisphaeraceae bacterium]|nr:sigma-70 family RNA polymerase sigma factor [Lentisphaeraceae bacterium]
MGQKTRQTLIQRIKNQYDEKSWMEFIEVYRPYIAAIIRNMGVPEDEIDDHVQSVLVICWQKLPSFDYDPFKGRFRYWLSRISSYTVNNHIRKIARRNELSEKMEIPHSIPAEVEKMADQEWKSFISKLAWENISSELSEKVKESFEMIMQGKKPVDIGTALEVEENTIHVYKRRVEKKLFKEIQKLRAELG